MRKGKKMLAIILGVLLVLVGGIVIFESVPYSPLKSEFKADLSKLIQNNSLEVSGEVFSERDFAGIPEPIGRYMPHCGYIGIPKMSYVKIVLNGAKFIQNGMEMRIDYTQYDFAAQPERLALIETSKMGIPFMGYDSLINGRGGMKGVLGKIITLFSQTGKEMDTACLVTLLADSPALPGIWLQDYVTLTGLDTNHVQASVKYKDMTVSGIFTFDEAGEIIKFTTDDRAMVYPDGRIEYVPWTTAYGDYRDNGEGVLLPYHLKAIWNYADGDLVYFDGVVDQIAYGN